MNLLETASQSNSPRANLAAAEMTAPHHHAGETETTVPLSAPSTASSSTTFRSQPLGKISKTSSAARPLLPSPMSREREMEQ